MARQRNNQSEKPTITTPKIESVRKSFAKRYHYDSFADGKTHGLVVRQSTGNFTLDASLYGGLAQGNLNIIAGWKDSGKTTQVAKAIAEGQKARPELRAVLLDIEGLYDPFWFEVNGVDTDNLLVVGNLVTAEQYLDVFQELVETGEVGIIAADSFGALIPQDQWEKSGEDPLKVGARAVLIGRMCSAYKGAKASMLSQDKPVPTFLAVNQYRDGIGKYSPRGTPKTLMGGHQQEYDAHTIIELKPPKQVEGVDAATGTKIITRKQYSYSIQKAKGGVYTKTGDYRIVTTATDPYFKLSEIDDLAEIMAWAKKFGMTAGGGSKQKFFIYPDEDFSPVKTEGGKSLKATYAMALRLRENPSDYQELKALIVAMIRLREKQPLTPVGGVLMGVTRQRLVELSNQLEIFIGGGS